VAIADRWLDHLDRRQRHGIAHERVLEALEHGRGKFGTTWTGFLARLREQ